MPKRIKAVGLGYLFGNRWACCASEVAGKINSMPKAKRRITLSRLISLARLSTSTAHVGLLRFGCNALTELRLGYQINTFD